jgi:hypothetical protein
MGKNLQLQQHTKPADREYRKRLREETRHIFDSDEIFLYSTSFFYVKIFKFNGIMNGHNCRIWDSQPHQETIEQKKGYTKDERSIWHDEGSND